MKDIVYSRFILLLVLLSAMGGCGPRDVPDDCPAGVIRIRLDWKGLSGSAPQGKWLVFYSDDKPTEPFVQEVSDEIYIDTLALGCYRVLLLAMDKDITRLDFVRMKEFEQATLSLIGLQEDIGLYPGAEMVFNESLSFDLTRPILEVVILKPKPLALNANFAINIPEVRDVQASLKGIPTEMNLWVRKATYRDQEHHTILTSHFKGNQLTLSSMILMPTPGGQLMRAEQIVMWLEVDVTYNSGVREALKVDVTQALNEAAAQAPPEVTFELKKVGLTATIVGWEIGTGQGDISIN